MPAHLSFSFGVGNYFNFKFAFGSPRIITSSGNDRSVLTDLEIARKSGFKVDDPKKPVKAIDQPECPLFHAVPVEIRHMIYRHLLTTPRPIEKAHKHLASKETAMLDNYHPIPNLDAAILRTCRLIYSEALPILYGQNIFEFACTHHIRLFQSRGLIAYGFPSAFNFKVAPHGRLTMLRSLTLLMGTEYPWHSQVVAHGQHRRPDRDRIWRDWAATLFTQEQETYCPWTGRDVISFPALEKLKLDFSDWNLGVEEGLFVKPFVKKLGEHGGLQELVLKGVKHQATIENFRKGLVKEGGTFRCED